MPPPRALLRRRPRTTAAVVLAGVAALALTACGGGATSSAGGSGTPATAPATTPATTAATTPSTPSSGPSTKPAASTTTVPRFAHVVVVVMENHSSDQLLGNPQAPYFNALAARGTTLTQSYALTHPSQPNYLALFSGSAQGVTDDSCPQSFSGDNLAQQLQAAGKSFAGYSEDLPAPGSTVCGAGLYARKHNPWSDFTNVPASANQPLSAMPTSYDALPSVSFVIPNLCHDVHSCPVSQGDTWLRQNLDSYAGWAVGHDSLLVVTFDEDDDTPTNRIPTLLVGAHVRTGSDAERVTHYGVLRTIEESQGLPAIGGAASAQPVRGAWTG